MTPSRIPAVPLAAFAAVLVAACAPGGEAGSPNLLLVTLDTVRADRLGCYGRAEARTPVLDRLAAEGVWFDDAVAVAPVTLPSHASILTGRYPTKHGARMNLSSVLADDQRTLAEVLREHGYSTGAAVGVYVLDSRFGLAQGFDRYLDEWRIDPALQFQDPFRTAAEVNRDAEVLLDGFPADRPFFLWVHYFDPHAPYEPPADLAREFPDTDAGRYDGEIAAADRALGELLSQLRRRGWLERTLIVVIGDHGEGFPGPHEEKTHGFFAYQDTLRIPFLIRGPGVPARGLRIGDLVRQVDVVPTVLELLGLPPLSGIDASGIDAPEIDGRSLVPRILDPHGPAKDETLSYSEAVLPWTSYGWAPLYVAQTSRWKLILAPRPELYDLESDPGEQVNVVDEHPEVASRLRRVLGELRAGSRQSRRELVAGELEAARSLGYAGGADELPDDHEGLADPKDKLAVYAALQRMLRPAAGMDRTADLEELAKLVAANPDSYGLHEGLAQLLADQGRLEEAVASARELTRLRPDSAQAHAMLGELLMRRARTARDPGEASKWTRQARASLERAVAGDPPDFAPYGNLALIHLQRGELEQAERRLVQARERNATDFGTVLNLAYVRVQTNRFEAAEEPLARAEELAGDDPARLEMVWQLAAQFHLARGQEALSRGEREAGERDRARAEALLRRLLERFPGSPAAAGRRQLLEQIRRS